MVKKKRVVVFTPTNARVVVNPPNIEAFIGAINCVIDPDLTEVDGIPPHFWKRTKDDKIVPMKGQELHDRLTEMSSRGIITPENFATETKRHRRNITWWIWGPALISVLAVTLVMWWASRR